MVVQGDVVALVVDSLCCQLTAIAARVWMSMG